MKSLRLVLLLACSTFAFGTQAPAPPAAAPPLSPPASRKPFVVDRPVRIQSDSITREGTVTHYRGNVQMVTDTMLLRADELDFDSKGQKADARGNVSFQLLPVTPRIVPLGGDSKPPR